MVESILAKKGYIFWVYHFSVTSGKRDASSVNPKKTNATAGRMSQRGKVYFFKISDVKFKNEFSKAN